MSDLDEISGTSRRAGPWGRPTRELWFYLYLTVSGLLLVRVLAPFLVVLLFAAIQVVVTWPLFQYVLSRVKRPALASVVTTAIIALVVFAPITALVWQFAGEAMTVTAAGVDALASGKLEAVVEDVQGWFAALQPPAWLAGYLPEGSVQTLIGDVIGDFNLVDAIVAPIQAGLLGALNATGTLVPLVVNTIVSGSIDVIIFLFAVLTLYVEGPTVILAVHRLSPLDDRYEARLFEVFREFANNLVVGSLATAAVQGFVAWIGYSIAGAPRAAFLGILTGVFSFVPMVGTLVVWLPVTLFLWATTGWGWALFLAIWSIAVTGTVDNLLKPLFLRGNTDIHPLLIFLAVFGGMAWLNLPGLIIGPIMAAFFLALYTIYLEEYLGIPSPAREPGRPWIPWLRGWYESLKGSLSKKTPAAAGVEMAIGAVDGIVEPLAGDRDLGPDASVDGDTDHT